MSDAGIAREALIIASGLKKLISLPNPVPGFAGKFDIAALCHVVIRRNDEQRRCVGRGVGIGKIFEPGNEIRALRNLVRNFTVVALILSDELDCRAGSGVVA